MFSSTHDCELELKNVDLKATPRRIAVLKALEYNENPSDVGFIFEFLKKRKIRADQATVFRILKLLSRRSLIKSIQLNESKLRYEPASRPDHHHFVCQSCGDILDIKDCGVDILKNKIEKEKNVKVRNHNMEFFGLCRNCQL